jgi:hypothetical protein
VILRHSYIGPKRNPGGFKAARMVAVGKALDHVKYIQHRPGEDRGDGGREIFSDEGDDLQAKRVRKAVKGMEKSKVVIHKLTLAPEINGFDQKAFTREVMKKLGSEKGLDLAWYGVSHENTDHSHIHVVVLGKDKNGREVRITKRDYSKIKAYGDRYLEMEHPLEMERSRRDRAEKERQHLWERNQERINRAREGLDLPFMKKMMARQTYQPYDEWKKQTPKVRERQYDENDKPYFMDTIEYGGKEYSKENSLEELDEFNKHLWEQPFENRLEIDEYRKLVAWMHEKENQRDGKISDKDIAKLQKDGPKPIEQVRYGKEIYDKDSTHQELKDLKSQLREKGAKRLPIDEYNQIQYWAENQDRARYQNNLQQEMDRVDKKFNRSKSSEDLKAQEGGRVLNVAQENFTSSGYFVAWSWVANLANKVVAAIPVLDNRDRLKEGRDDLEDAKLDKVVEHNAPGRDEQRKAQDRETIEKIDKAIDRNQEARDESNDEKKRKKRERDDEEDPFQYDPWGRY